MSPTVIPAAGPDAESERSRLEDIAGRSRYAAGVNAAVVRYGATVFARHWTGQTCLELGPAEGLMTDLLVPHFDALTVVDGSARFCADLAARHAGIRAVPGLFETVELDGRFDTVILGQVLEHVTDPVTVLRRCREWLSPTGVLCCCVPNADSLHRRAAVLMGLLADEHELNDADLAHGHRRVYDPPRLRADIEAAGLAVVHAGGYWLKPLSNAQIEATWDEAMIDAYLRLGEQFPDVAALTYVVARP